MTSVFAEISGRLESSRPNGFRQDLTTKPPNGLRKSMTLRPTNDQLSMIETHNNEAIRAGKCAYLSDGGEDSDNDDGNYRRGSIDLSPYSSDSSSEDENYRRNQLRYEHYDPDMFEPDEIYDERNEESDDCNFGKSTKRHIMREILHNGVEIRPNIIDDFGGWDTTFTVKNSKPSRSNIRRYTKIPRTPSSAFPRPNTEPKDSTFLFKHYDDISEYIKQYRKEESIKDNRLKTANEGEEAMLIPDPYAAKLKGNMCSIAENCDFLTVYASSTKEKADKMKEKEACKEKQQSIILPRPRPSSLVYCPSHDSDEDGPQLRRDRPTSLIYYPATASRPVIVTSFKRTDSSLSVKEKSNEREFSAEKQNTRLQPRPFSDHPFVVRTLSVKDRRKMLNLAPVRNQETSEGFKKFKTVHPNLSLEHYLNLVVPHRQTRSSSNSTTHSLNATNEMEEKNTKPALHKKNIQLNLDGPGDPWTPKFEMKRSLSRGAINLPRHYIYSAGHSRKRSTSTPDSLGAKQWPNRSELTLSRANTYHDNIDNELSVNVLSSSRTNPPNVQRVYGQRFRCCERIHALINNEDLDKKSKDRHIKLSVDNMKCDKTNPVSFGSFGIRKGMSREDNPVSLSCMYKLKRDRQRRFNISLVK
ncbi:uncharacterized protein LOC127710504 isoform X3 [Mytilus californianus]|uniref:uncharacterized protein LOC127710504 isoform X3 n=1 Tax=Mytilus californianus TaxID=6549 RepID=UPI0022486282|nr:uncharacterized protein LOC127710504 isoform X3 [Mytilus californianus]